jgi:hypothetical protein
LLDARVTLLLVRVLPSAYRRAPLRIPYLLKHREPAGIEAVDPVVHHREVAADPLADRQRAQALPGGFDDPLSLVDPHGKREVASRTFARSRRRRPPVRDRSRWRQAIAPPTQVEARYH